MYRYRSKSVWRQGLLLLCAAVMLLQFPIVSAMSSDTSMTHCLQSDEMKMDSEQGCQGCCQHDINCQNQCLSCITLSFVLPGHAIMISAPIRYAQVVTLPDKIFHSLPPTPQYYPPR